MCVLTILVTYFDHETGEVRCGHLGSISCLKVDAETIYNELKDFFETLQLPWSNVMSMLMDSCSVMRGSKSGLEKRIRDNLAPHLLDIDGDSCHHIHNVAKKFTKPYDKFLEKLFSGIYNEFYYAADSKEIPTEYL